VESLGKEDLVVVLGSPTVESAETFAETAINGDPSYAGPLAGIALKLPVYHVFEHEIKSQSDPMVYEKQVAFMEDVLEKVAIIEAVRKVRERTEAP